jgi:hypothetical protein
MQGSRFGFIGIFVSLLIAVVAGVIGYNLGLSAGLATTADGAATRVIYAPGGFGFGGFGLLFGILFFVLIFSLLRRAAWGGSRGWYGRGGWGHYAGQGHDHSRVPSEGNPMFDDWHRRAHGEPTSQPGGQSGAGDAGTSSSGGTPTTRS